MIPFIDISQHATRFPRAPRVRLIQLWRLWRQRSRERRLAAQFSDRDLWDVGLTRGDIYREFANPFWQW